MEKLWSRAGRARVGLPPGSVVYVGEKRVDRVSVQVIDYDEKHVEEREVARPEEYRALRDASTATWINVTGLHDTALLQQIGEVFGIHPLTLEDIVNVRQRPKFEDQGDHVLLVLKMFYHRPGGREVVAEQVSMVLGQGYVISFQEAPGDVFDAVRERIRAGKGRIRRMGADYLAYSLLDAVVDNYFVVLEDLGEKIEAVEGRVMQSADKPILRMIHELRREMIFVRRTLWPLRELVSAFEKSESPLIQKALRPYLRDVYEHTAQVMDTVESYRDMLSSALEIYMTNVSNRMNEVMKVLTVIATIFIPLTFIAGVYGMNFDHMPELRWRLGYLGVWIVMSVVAGGMLVHFRRRKWL